MLATTIHDTSHLTDETLSHHNTSHEDIYLQLHICNLFFLTIISNYSSNYNILKILSKDTKADAISNLCIGAYIMQVEGDGCIRVCQHAL